MRTVLQTILLLLLALATASSASARKQSEKKSNEKPTTIFIFGVAQDLADTTVYVSAITTVAGAKLNSGGDLENWTYYSEQLKKYVEATFQRPHQTVAVYYDKKLKNVEKRYQKVETQIRKKSPYPPTFKHIRPEDFHFKVPRIIFAEEE